MTARTAGALLWLLIGGLAAVAVFWQLAHSPQPPAPGVATQSPELPSVAPLPPFALPPLDHYGEITAHPVFIATRQPEPPPPDDAPPVVEKPPAGPELAPTLLGVVIMPSTTAALMRPGEPNAKTAWVRIGEKVGEWQLEAVFPNRIVLRKGEATQELELKRQKKPAGPPGGKRAGAKPGPPMAPPGATPPAPGAVVPGAVPPAMPPQPDAPLQPIVPGMPQE